LLLVQIYPQPNVQLLTDMSGENTTVVRPSNKQQKLQTIKTAKFEIYFIILIANPVCGLRYIL